MRYATVIAVLGLFVFSLVSPAAALTFKVFDSKTGDGIAGAEVSLRYFTRMYKPESHLLSALTDEKGIGEINLPEGTMFANTPHNISYAVDKAGWSLGVVRGTLASAHEESIIVRLDRDPLAMEAPARSLPVRWLKGR